MLSKIALTGLLAIAGLLTGTAAAISGNRVSEKPASCCAAGLPCCEAGEACCVADAACCAAKPACCQIGEACCVK